MIHFRDYGKGTNLIADASALFGVALVTGFAYLIWKPLALLFVGVLFLGLATILLLIGRPTGRQ